MLSEPDVGLRIWRFLEFPLRSLAFALETALIGRPGLLDGCCDWLEPTTVTCCSVALQAVLMSAAR